MKHVLMLLSLVAVGVASGVSSDANAQISGWGWWGYSSLQGYIDTSKVPPPKTKPSVLIVKAPVADVQIACKNPADNGIYNGNAFSGEFQIASPIGDGDITDRKRAKATTFVSWSLDDFDDPTETQWCPNSNWIPVDESAMVLHFTFLVNWHLCTGDDLDGDGDTDPCSDTDPGTGEPVYTIDESRKGLLDSKAGGCTWNLTTYPRNPDGTAPHVTLEMITAGEPSPFVCTPPQ